MRPHINEDITLDNWKPSEKEHRLLKSDWRTKQNKNSYNHEPGIDELKKINRHLSRKYPDCQIMEAFGINAETLLAIKRGCYGPIEGISLDNQSKIYKEFSKINKKLDKFMDALKFLSDNAFDDNNTSKRMALRALIGNRKEKKEIQAE